MNVLFVNTPRSQCGVHQYGENLFEVIRKSTQILAVYGEFATFEEFRSRVEQLKPDAVIYNWQQIIGGWMGGAPFPGCGRQVLAYHDLGARFDAFDAIIFSDPSMPQHGNWFPIGRPLNIPEAFVPSALPEGTTAIGVNGLLGAWALHAVYQATRQFNPCRIRLQLPASTFCDPYLQLAQYSAHQCTTLFRYPHVSFEVCHDYLPWDRLVQWLSGNHMNLYVRNVEVPWRGVSSIVDAALCARRPISVNRCSAFRHMHDCSPSIVVEDRPLPDILNSGLAPLEKKYEEYAPERVAGQVYSVLEKII